MKKEIIHLFDQYLAGELTGQEKADLEARLEASEALSKEFRQFKTSVEAMLELPQYAEARIQAQKMKGESEKAAGAQFKKYRSGEMNEAEKRAFEGRLKEEPLFEYRYKKFLSEQSGPAGAASVIPLRKYLRMAAAAALVVGACLLVWLLLPARVDTEGLYAAYNIPELYPAKEIALVNEGIVHRGIEGSREFHQLRLDGLDAYEAKDWDGAISLLTQFLRQAVPDSEETSNEINLVNLYIGVAWLEKSETKKAIEALLAAEEGITDHTNYRLVRELVRWQLALSYLKNQNVRAAKSVLKKLEKAEHPLILEQARKLKSELK